MKASNTNNLPHIVILAGGLGTRLRNLTASKPKAMVSVLGEPFIAHQLRLLKSRGASDIILSVKHFAQQIEDFVGDGGKWGLSITYSYDGDKLLGTGGAVLKAVSNAKNQSTEFAVLYGDSYLDVDYLAVYSDFQNAHKLGLMTVLKNNNEFVPSNVWMENGQIKAYGKANPSPFMQHVDYGLSFYKSAAFAPFEGAARGEAVPFDLAEVTLNLIDAKELATIEVSRRFYEVGSLEGIEDLERYMRSTG